MPDVSFPFAQVGIACPPASKCCGLTWLDLFEPNPYCNSVTITVSIFEGWLGSRVRVPPLLRLHGLPTGHFWVSVQSYHHSAGLSMPLAMGHCPLGPGKRARGAFPAIKDSRDYQKILKVPNCHRTIRDKISLIGVES